MKKNKQERLAAKAAAKAQNSSPKSDEVSNVKGASETTEGKKKKKPVEPSKDEQELDTQSATAVVKKITKEKDLKYNYPEEVDTLSKRKKFRAEVRRTIAGFEKAISKLMASENKEDKALLKAKTKAADAYLKEHLAQPAKA